MKTNRNKRKLYESIMKDVSKTVKRNLNETADFSDVQGEEFKINIYTDEEGFYYADITTENLRTGEVETTHYKSYDYNDIAEKIGQYIIGLYFFNNLFKYGNTEPDIIF